MTPRIAHLAVLVGLVVVVVVAPASMRSSASASLNAPSSRVPRWASTGFIAYRCRDELCLMRPDGSGKRHLLSAGPSPQWDPGFSPQGQMLGFRGYYGLGDGQYALYVIGTNRCALHRLTDSIAGDPSWSPDGQWIAFDTSGAGEIWKVHPDGTGLTRIRGEGQGWDPAWSPDGTRIAFVHFQVGAGGEIWVMGADGSSATLLHKDARVSDEKARLVARRQADRLPGVRRPTFVDRGDEGGWCRRAEDAEEARRPNGTRSGCPATRASPSSPGGRTARIKVSSSCARTEVTCTGWHPCKPSSSRGSAGDCRSGAADGPRT